MENRIKEYNEWLFHQDLSKLGPSLFTGKTGLCLYWYQQSRVFGNREYETLADSLIEEIIQQIDRSTSIEFGNGLVGIALSILYLEKQHYIEGNPLEMMKDITDKIYQALYFGIMSRSDLTTVDLISLVYALLYFCKCLYFEGMPKSERNVIVGIIIKGINLLEQSTRNASINETAFFSPSEYFVPLFLRLIKQVYELDVFSYKLDMICKEWKNRILTTIPRSDGNRFILMTELEHLSPLCRPSECQAFQSHAKLLKGQTDLSRFIKVEMRSRNIFLHAGLSGLLLYSVFAGSPIKENCYVHIANRILQSPLWDDWKMRPNEFPFFLSNSLTGVIYSYQQFFSYLKQ